MQKVTYKGITYKSVTLACDLLGIDTSSVRKHTKKGLSIEQAIDCVMSHKQGCVDHLGNMFKSKKAMAEFYNLPPERLYERLQMKWDLETALTHPRYKNRGKTDNAKLHTDSETQ